MTNFVVVNGEKLAVEVDRGRKTVFLWRVFLGYIKIDIFGCGRTLEEAFEDAKKYPERQGEKDEWYSRESKKFGAKKQ